MDTLEKLTNRTKWRFNLLTLYILLLATTCQGNSQNDETKTDVELENKLDSNHCHNCYNSHKEHVETYVDDIVGQFNTFTEENFNLNSTVIYLERVVEDMLDKALTQEKFKIFDGVEIEATEDRNDTRVQEKVDAAGRALFSKYTYEYRLYQKVKDFVNTHILSINLPMAAKCKYKMYL